VPNLHIYATSLPQRLALLYLQHINRLSSLSASAGAMKASTLTDTVSFCATALSLSREAGQRHLDLFKSMAGKESSNTGLLVCKTDKPINLPGKNTALPWLAFPDWLADLIE
jgi:hypothetical protein